MTVAVNFADRGRWPRGPGSSAGSGPSSGAGHRAARLRPWLHAQRNTPSARSALFEGAAEDRARRRPRPARVGGRARRGRGRRREVARLLADGYNADEIVIVVRHPDRGGPLYRQVLEGFGIPVALEASIPLSRTASGAGPRPGELRPQTRAQGTCSTSCGLTGREGSGDRGLGRALHPPRQGRDGG